MSTQSLPEQFHDALTAIKSMDEEIDADHANRHLIRRIKRMAVDEIERAFLNAHDLAYHAKELGKS